MTPARHTRSRDEAALRRWVLVMTVVFSGGWALMVVLGIPSGLHRSQEVVADFEYVAHDLPALQASLAQHRVPRSDPGSLRDPFQFGSPAPVDRQDKVRSEPPAEPAGKVPGAHPQPLDDPCATIRSQYLGWLGPARIRVAAIRHDGSVEVAIPGDRVDDGFIVTGFDAETLTLRRGPSEEPECVLPVAAE